AQGNYKRAFLGAKLGRMKNFQIDGKQPWRRKPIPGEIYVSISSTFSWNNSPTYPLVSTLDIPLESSTQSAVSEVGESQWFWKEIPLSQIQFNAENYVAVWSPTGSLDSAQKAPILAGGWGTREVDSWVCTEPKILTPPACPLCSLKSLKPVTAMEPAIALKLVPEQKESDNPRVSILNVEEGKRFESAVPYKILWCSVQGESVERAWIEVSTDSSHWNKHGRFLWKAPYSFSISLDEFPIGPDGKSWVRARAADSAENVGSSPAINLFERSE
ncbi:MAG: hypothetical protein HYS58_03175, partial [Elusimicrobia bacterium]|nr:hypothetical protein [Elusimicrobiota bacterium]